MGTEETSGSGVAKEVILKISDFKKGDKVLYIPQHAIGDPNHPDREHGVVKSTNDSFVFVLYDNQMCVMETGDEPYTAQATKPEDLRLKEE